MVKYGLWFLLVGGVIAGVAWMTARSVLGGPRMRRLLCSIPLFGGVLRNSALMEYCHLLAVLIESRMPLPEALRYAGGGVHDADLADASKRLADDVAGGQPFAWTAAAMPQFPAMFSQFVKWGERHHSYPEALHAAGDIFEGRARVQASLLTWLIEPFVIIGVGLCVAVIVLAMFMPLIKLLNDLT
jgi:type II secretory pathway component PulF